jgi:hypothetical protein
MNLAQAMAAAELPDAKRMLVGGNTKIIMGIIPGNFTPPLIASFFIWAAYRRFRRNIGRQPLQPKRMVVRVVLMGLATLVVAAVSLLHTPSLISLGIALVLGVPLAMLGLHLTRFETTPDGRFYTPNTYIGLGLSILFAARIVYRSVVLQTNAPTFTGAQSPAFMHSPLTMFIFGLLASYTMAYYIGVILRSYD